MLINERFHYTLYYDNEYHFHSIKCRCQVFLLDPDQYWENGGKSIKIEN